LNGRLLCVQRDHKQLNRSNSAVDDDYKIDESVAVCWWWGSRYIVVVVVVVIVAVNDKRYNYDDDDKVVAFVVDVEV